jgi:hypothetical protein
MLILGNLYKQDDQLWVIVLSSNKLDDYKYVKKTIVVDKIVIYQYKIQIDEKNTRIKIGDETINIPNITPELNNTSIYFVSCDGQFMKKVNDVIPIYNIEDDDMWKKLYMDIQADSNTHKYVIHLGDQVYMDAAHKELIENKTTDDPDIVKRTYYKYYKVNYENKYKKKVLESVHNIMVGDDHDVLDGYGSITNNLTQTMLDNVKKMYKTFQEDLYSVELHNIKHLVFNDFQIIIPDLRKYRKLYTDNSTKYPIMGETQMKELEDIIKNTQTKIKRTYYVNTIPLVGVNKLLNNLISAVSGNKTLYIDDYISSDGYLNERKHVVNELFKLNNDVVVIGGDYHYAEYYNFIKNGKTIKQIITSPISSPHPGVLGIKLIDDVAEIVLKILYDRIISDTQIEKKWVVLDYNYLKVTEQNATLRCCDDKNNKIISM